MNYLIVLPVLFHRVSPGTFATESAFCDHLRMLRRELDPAFGRLIIAAPSMPDEYYQIRRNYFSTIDEHEEQIWFVPLNPGQISPIRYWTLHLLPTIWRLNHQVRAAAVVHAGPSHIYEPREFIALMLGVLTGRKTICVVDVDERRSAWMNFVTGRWSKTSYRVNHQIYDRLISIQLRLAARFCSLLLLKGQSLVDDYGRGRPNVKNFLDTAYSAEHIIPEERFERKAAVIADRSNPLELAYFGRLTDYKGIDRTIEALKAAIDQVGRVFRLHIIGTGEKETALREFVCQRELDDVVQFHGAIPFGPALFDRLYGCHLLLATPLSEDTPRSALDAMAAGMPVLAFDTYYYQSLSTSGAVECTPWPEVTPLAEKLVELEKNRARLVALAKHAIDFARGNTQEQWIERRMAWTREFCFNGDDHDMAPKI